MDMWNSQIAARNKLPGVSSRPCCSIQIIILHSIQEMLVIAACGGFSLSIYEYSPHALEGQRLTSVAAYLSSLQVEHAHVALSLGDTVGSTRGHYSRLFTARQWQEHRNSVEHQDIAFSDTSACSGGLAAPCLGSSGALHPRCQWLP